MYGARRLLSVLTGIAIVSAAAAARGQQPAARVAPRGYSDSQTIPLTAPPDGRASQAGYAVPPRQYPDRERNRRPQNYGTGPVGQPFLEQTPPARTGHGGITSRPGENGQPHATPPLRSAAAAGAADASGAASLRISRDGEPPENAPGASNQRRSAGGGLWTTFASLAALILVLLGGARLWKRHGPRLGNVIPGEAVEVLGRRPVDARHAIVLVRLGSRILVLSSGPGGLQTLSELSDPVEVDFLAGQCRRHDPESTVAQTFRSLFQLQSLRGSGATDAGRPQQSSAEHQSQFSASYNAHEDTDHGSYAYADGYDEPGGAATQSWDHSPEPRDHTEGLHAHADEDASRNESMSAPDERDRPRADSEAILQRLRMHSLGGAPQRTNLQQQSGRAEGQYHDAG